MRKINVSIEYEGNYIILKHDCKSCKKVDVYYGKTADYSLENKSLLITMDTTETKVINPDKENRLYFLMCFDTGEHYLTSTRLVNLKGTNNFRDIGGYETIEGKEVKWGLLYRSDQLSDITEKDIEYLEKMKLKSIVDYRSDAEGKSYPNKYIEGTNTYKLDPNAKIAQLASGSIDDNKKVNKSTIELLKANEFDPKEYGDPEQNMYFEYRKFVYSDEAKNAYKELMNLVLNPENLPLVQHCRGGKDRTGFGVAVILLALGVSEEDIIKDYELTTFYRKERNEKQMNLYRQYTDDEEILTLLSTMQMSKGEYIKSALDEMKKTFGSVDKYLEEILGVNEEVKNKLKENLLY